MIMIFTHCIVYHDSLYLSNIHWLCRFLSQIQGCDSRLLIVHAKSSATILPTRNMTCLLAEVSPTPECHSWQIVVDSISFLSTVSSILASKFYFNLLLFIENHLHYWLILVHTLCTATCSEEEDNWHSGSAMNARVRGLIGKHKPLLPALAQVLPRGESCNTITFSFHSYIVRTHSCRLLRVEKTRTTHTHSVKITSFN